MKKLFTLLYFQLCVDIIGLPLYYISVGSTYETYSKYFKSKTQFKSSQIVSH